MASGTRAAVFQMHGISESVKSKWDLTFEMMDSGVMVGYFAAR